MPDTYALPRVDAETALSRHRAGDLDLLDLRKPAARQADGRSIHGALSRDPFEFGHGDPMTRSGRPIAVFCVHGHEVSRFGAALLLLHGRDAAYVEGGFAALVAAGADIRREDA